MSCIFTASSEVGERRILRCVKCDRVVSVPSRLALGSIKRTCVTDANISMPIGPGYCLSQLLNPISNATKWLQTDGGCDCLEYAAEMDRMGVEWCEANIDTIVGWLREGAAAHSLPFSATVARWFVNRAIRQAKTISE